jgi:hypothetical protein
MLANSPVPPIVPPGESTSIKIDSTSGSAISRAKSRASSAFAVAPE